MISVGLIDRTEVDFLGKPPAPLTIEDLHLAPLPPAVRVAEPDVDGVALGDGLPAGPLGPLVEGDRPQEVGWDPIEAAAWRATLLTRSHGAW